MNIKDVRDVINASIFNPTMRRDAKDFVDAQAVKIEEHESTIRGQDIIINAATERIFILEAYIQSAKEWFDNFGEHAPIYFGGEDEMANKAAAILADKVKI